MCFNCAIVRIRYQPLFISCLSKFYSLNIMMIEHSLKILSVLNYTPTGIYQRTHSLLKNTNIQTKNLFGKLWNAADIFKETCNTATFRASLVSLKKSLFSLPTVSLSYSPTSGYGHLLHDTRSWLDAFYGDVVLEKPTNRCCLCHDKLIWTFANSYKQDDIRHNPTRLLGLC